MKLKLLAAALAIGFAAQANAAPIDNTTNAGGLFFNMWDATGSYTRNLNLRIDSFESGVGTAGLFDQTWAADSTFTSWVSGHAGAVWNIEAIDVSGARRVLNTFTLGTPLTPTSSAANVRAGATNVQTWLTNVNPSLASSDSATFTAADPGYAGLPGDNFFSFINYSNAGTAANNSYATGLGFMKINAPSTGAGTVASLNYSPYSDDGIGINAYLDGSNGLHLAAVAAVPEPETYGMLAAGLLMLGAVARRRRG